VGRAFPARKNIPLSFGKKKAGQRKPIPAALLAAGKKFFCLAAQGAARNQFSLPTFFFKRKLKSLSFIKEDDIEVRGSHRA